VLVFKESMLTANRLATDQADRRAHNETEKQAAIPRMTQAVEAETRTAMEQISLRTGDLAKIAERMTKSASRTGSSAQTATNPAGHALVNVHTVADATEHLAASIREISVGVSAHQKPTRPG
jgi:hypothetical protein